MSAAVEKAPDVVTIRISRWWATIASGLVGSLLLVAVTAAGRSYVAVGQLQETVTRHEAQINDRPTKADLQHVVTLDTVQQQALLDRMDLLQQQVEKRLDRIEARLEAR